MTHDPAPGLTRRRLVRTAGTAAWTAPVIVAATAAPAHASSVNAAILRAPDPTFLVLNNRITIISQYKNFGTGTAASMMVTVTLTPVVGTLADQNPAGLDPAFAFISRTSSPAGVQVLSFMKVDPQIAPDDVARLMFDVLMDPGLGGVRTLDVSLAPTVPPPSTAAPSEGQFTSTGRAQ